METYNILNGYNIQKIADKTYDFTIVEYKDVEIQVKATSNFSNIKQGDIIFCKTDILESFFHQIQDLHCKIVLLTHCSDRSITESLYNLKPKCIYSWFSENVDTKQKDLFPVPIGVESFNGFMKSRYMKSHFDVFRDVYLDRFNFDKKINKLYCNFRLNTNSKREKILESLLGYPYSYAAKIKPFKEYFEELKTYKFIASPRGNGIDCHRTWDALYAGSIPVVEGHFIYDTFDLPIIQIKNWNELSIDMLHYKAEQLSKNSFNINQLTTLYWVEKIKSISNQLKSQF